MSETIAESKRTRLDARLSKEQRTLFERAAAIGGYKNFTHFVLSSANEKAQEIIKRNEAIIASERDAEIFFEAIMNPPAPNAALQNAFRGYNVLLKSK